MNAVFYIPTFFFYLHLESVCVYGEIYAAKLIYNVTKDFLSL